jgi:hypothetical protein
LDKGGRRLNGRPTQGREQETEGNAFVLVLLKGILSLSTMRLSHSKHAKDALAMGTFDVDRLPLVAALRAIRWLRKVPPPGLAHFHIDLLAVAADAEALLGTTVRLWTLSCGKGGAAKAARGGRGGPAGGR